MMTPVGRLIVLRTVPRAEIIGAIAWLSIPALVGPVVGPPLGGFITTYFNWRWIFWINIPVAVAGTFLITRFIPDVREETSTGFDLRGFLLIGPGLSLFLTGVTLMGVGLASRETDLLVTLCRRGAARCLRLARDARPGPDHRFAAAYRSRRFAPASSAAFCFAPVSAPGPSCCRFSFKSGSG